jgi:hypothetical protein
MVCYIMMGFYMYSMTMFDFKLSKPNMMFLVINHFQFNKAMELMSRDYWWPQLWKYVKEFVELCDIYA